MAPSEWAVLLLSLLCSNREKESRIAIIDERALCGQVVITVSGWAYIRLTQRTGRQMDMMALLVVNWFVLTPSLLLTIWE